MTRRHPTSKKGFELSVGFIVILIITIIIFTSSLVIIKRFWSTTQTIQSSLSTDVQNQIDAVLGQGQAVAVVPSQVDATPGKQQTVGVGIMNVNKAEYEFHIGIGFSGAFDNDNQPISEAINADIMNKWLLYSSGPYKLTQGKSEKTRVLIEPGFTIDDDVRTKPGTYIFNVCVSARQIGGTAPAAAFDPTTFPTNCGNVGKTGSGTNLASLYSKKVYKLQVVID